MAEARLFRSLLCEEQELLFENAVRLMRDEAARDAGPLAIWRAMQRLGWIEGCMGGAPSRFASACTLAEAHGAAGVQSPFVASALALWLLEAIGRTPEAGLLTVPAVFAPPPSSGMAAARYRRDGAGGTLSRCSFYVEHAADAGQLLVAAAFGGEPKQTAFMLLPVPAAGVRLLPLDTSGGRYQYAVRFDGAACGTPLATGVIAQAAVDRLLLHGALLRAAELAGIGRAALELTLRYSKQRVQFGRPIASFQAVHHHFADMLRDLTAARLLVAQAADRLDAGLPVEREIRMAKAKASEAIPALLRTAHQLTGGAGFYRDYPLEGFYRRALDARASYGNALEHRRRLAALHRENPDALRHEDAHES
jgi:alkylation response protein AidB-like acyl-CoA dehydrogenase